MIDDDDDVFQPNSRSVAMNGRGARNKTTLAPNQKELV